MALEAGASNENRIRRSRRSSQRPDYTAHGIIDHSDHEGDDIEYEPPTSWQQQPYHGTSSQQDPRSGLVSVQEAEGRDSPARASSDPPDPDRPNRYHGSASTWKDWTAADRAIVQSLDRLKARDLSVHLYNVHHLKLRAQQARNGEARPKSQKHDGWAPPVHWTAWPMSARHVPRSQVSGDVGTYSQPILGSVVATRNSLRETLLAHVTKIARQRFADRDCEGCDGKHSYNSAEKQSQDVSDRQATDSATEDDGNWQFSRGGRFSEKPEPSLSSSLKRSHSGISASSSRSRKQRLRSEEEEELEPAPIADDDAAMRIASTSIEHIISSLEGLLQGLHTTRKHYFDQSDKNEERRAQRRKQKGKQKAWRSDGQAHENEDVEESRSESEASTQVSSTYMSSSLDNRGNYQDYGLRDWKDVLGLAAILGWDSEALQRARDRCTMLFKDPMPMMPLELSVQLTADESEKAETKVILSEDEIEGGVHIDGFLRPLTRRRGWRGRNKKKKAPEGDTKSIEESIEQSDHDCNVEEHEGGTECGTDDTDED